MTTGALDVRLLTGFPGANPSDPGRVTPMGDNTFTVYPFVESGGGAAYHFRCDMLLDCGPSWARVELKLDWQEPHYMPLREFVYHCPEEKGEWIAHPGTMEGETVRSFPLELGPGRHFVCAQPRYGLENLQRLEGLCQDGHVVRVETWKGDLGRNPVKSFELSRGFDSGRDLILVMGRAHPYETAGSFCLDGVVRAAVTDEEYREELLSKFDWVFVPVASPDGVVEGCCRLGAARGGLDPCRSWEPESPLGTLVRHLLRNRRIRGYLDIHSWMHGDVDGVGYLNALHMRRFTRLMDVSYSGCKPWKHRLRGRVIPYRMGGTMAVVRKRSGAVCAGLEYPWKGRGVECMERLGRCTMRAFAETVARA